MSQQNPNKPATARVDVRILLPMLGMLLAPFIGYLLSPNLGLIILIICLAVLGWMTWGVAKQVPAQQARTLRTGAILNGILAVAAALLLIYRI